MAKTDLIRGPITKFLVGPKPSGWGVALIPVEGAQNKWVRLAGVWPEDVRTGDVVEAVGFRETHKKYGEQFKVLRVVTHIPSGRQAIEAWMANRLPNVGPERAKALLDRFGATLWDVIDEEPHKLTAVKGITSDRVTEIIAAYRQFYKEREIIVSLIKAGLRVKQAAHAVEVWGASAPEVISENPYVLYLSLRDVDFQTADTVALKHYRVAEDDPRRVEAFTLTILREALVGGDCYMLRHTLTHKVASALKLEQSVVDEQLPNFPALVCYDKRVLSREIDHAERDVADAIRRRCA